MNPLFTFILGLLIGWLIEWLIRLLLLAQTLHRNRNTVCGYRCTGG